MNTDENNNAADSGENNTENTQTGETTAGATGEVNAAAQASTDPVATVSDPAATAKDPAQDEPQEPKLPEGVKLPQHGDTVNYVPLDSERENFGMKADEVITGTVDYANNNGADAILIKAQPKPGMSWSTGAHYSAAKEPGTWHWPA